MRNLRLNTHCLPNCIILPIGILTILKYPYPRSVEEPDVYDSIRVHAEGGSPEQKETPTFAVSYAMTC